MTSYVLTKESRDLNRPCTCRQRTIYTCIWMTTVWGRSLSILFQMRYIQDCETISVDREDGESFRGDSL